MKKGLSVLLSFLLVLVLSVSFSMPVNASSLSGSVTHSSTTSHYKIYQFPEVDLGTLSISSDLEDDKYYSVTLDSELNATFNTNTRIIRYFVSLSVGNSVFLDHSTAFGSGGTANEVFTSSSSGVHIFGLGSDLKNIQVAFNCDGINASTSTNAISRTGEKVCLLF